jgi:hypothetical protein
MIGVDGGSALHPRGRRSRRRAFSASSFIFSVITKFLDSFSLTLLQCSLFQALQVLLDITHFETSHLVFRRL